MYKNNIYKNYQITNYITITLNKIIIQMEMRFRILPKITQSQSYQNNTDMNYLLFIHLLSLMRHSIVKLNL